MEQLIDVEKPRIEALIAARGTESYGSDEEDLQMQQNIEAILHFQQQQQNGMDNGEQQASPQQLELPTLGKQLETVKSTIYRDIPSNILAFQNSIFYLHHQYQHYLVVVERMQQHLAHQQMYNSLLRHELVNTTRQGLLQNLYSFERQTEQDYKSSLIQELEPKLREINNNHQQRLVTSYPLSDAEETFKMLSMKLTQHNASFDRHVLQLYQYAFDKFSNLIPLEIQHNLMGILDPNHTYNTGVNVVIGDNGELITEHLTCEQHIQYCGEIYERIYQQILQTPFQLEKLLPQDTLNPTAEDPTDPSNLMNRFNDLSLLDINAPHIREEETHNIFREFDYFQQRNEADAKRRKVVMDDASIAGNTNETSSTGNYYLPLDASEQQRQFDMLQKLLSDELSVIDSSAFTDDMLSYNDDIDTGSVSSAATRNITTSPPSADSMTDDASNINNNSEIFAPNVDFNIFGANKKRKYILPLYVQEDIKVDELLYTQPYIEFLSPNTLQHHSRTDLSFSHHNDIYYENPGRSTHERQFIPLTPSRIVQPYNYIFKLYSHNSISQLHSWIEKYQQYATTTIDNMHNVVIPAPSPAASLSHNASYTHGTVMTIPGSISYNNPSANSFLSSTRSHRTAFLTNGLYTTSPLPLYVQKDYVDLLITPMKQQGLTHLLSQLVNSTLFAPSKLDSIWVVLCNMVNYMYNRDAHRRAQNDITLLDPLTAHQMLQQSSEEPPPNYVSKASRNPPLITTETDSLVLLSATRTKSVDELTLEEIDEDGNLIIPSGAAYCPLTTAESNGVSKFANVASDLSNLLTQYPSKQINDDDLQTLYERAIGYWLFLPIIGAQNVSLHDLCLYLENNYEAIRGQLFGDDDDDEVEQEFNEIRGHPAAGSTHRIRVMKKDEPGTTSAPTMGDDAINPTPLTDLDNMMANTENNNHDNEAFDDDDDDDEDLYHQYERNAQNNTSLANNVIPQSWLKTLMTVSTGEYHRKFIDEMLPRFIEQRKEIDQQRALNAQRDAEVKLQRLARRQMLLKEKEEQEKAQEQQHTQTAYITALSDEELERRTILLQAIAMVPQMHVLSYEQIPDIKRFMDAIQQHLTIVLDPLLNPIIAAHEFLQLNHQTFALVQEKKQAGCVLSPEEEQLFDAYHQRRMYYEEARLLLVGPLQDWEDLMMCYRGYDQHVTNLIAQQQQHEQQILEQQQEQQALEQQMREQQQVLEQQQAFEQQQLLDQQMIEQQQQQLQMQLYEQQQQQQQQQQQLQEQQQQQQLQQQQQEQEQEQEQIHQSEQTSTMDDSFDPLLQFQQQFLQQQQLIDQQITADAEAAQLDQHQHFDISGQSGEFPQHLYQP